MAEYIEREALMVALCNEITGDGDYYNGKDDMQGQIRDMVSRFPAADVAPVRKGRWESVGLSSLKCSDCGYLDDMKMYHRYCPDCGCFMR